MKVINLVVVVLLLASCSSRNSKSAITKEDWKLGAQTYTFHRFSFMETLSKAKELGLAYVEVYYGQKLGEGFEDKTMSYTMDAETQQQVLKACKDKGVEIIASGVVICEDEADWRQLFGFAKNMGIETITCEPKPEHLDLVEKLCDEYKIDIAIHNHPQPSAYWNPDVLMQYIKDRSPRIGTCSDVGHWKREGIDPIEGLKKCEGRIKMLHFKDIAAKQEGVGEQHDIIWGQGVCNVAGMLAELKRQNFKGTFSIEYENNWDNSVPDIKECITYYNQITSKLFE